ncbi:hypothetical protein HK098_007684 [Nowakowskiella sp. JEL0407]|nr:hypothetical protein HK098_007684 [Nowakowskiella sp. JEL0407]
MTRLISILLSLSIPLYVFSASFLSCPPGLPLDSSRQPERIGPCESGIENAAVNNVNAGDKLKVAGGYVRLALAPETSLTSQTFDSNVLKQTCFGTDERPNRAGFGNCVHPCNARGGCSWQTESKDRERYDTTITIPYNLADGVYYLQWIALQSTDTSPTYSCAKLYVQGGTPSLNCTQDEFPVAGCTDFGMVSNPFNVRSKAGAFCFAPDGNGRIDAKLSKKPVNYQCDPRVSCDISFNTDLCKQDYTNNCTAVSTDFFPSEETNTYTESSGPPPAETSTSSVYTSYSILDEASPGSSPTPSNCISAGLITDHEAFCADWERVCSTTCIQRSLIPIESNMCESIPASPFGVGVKCLCGQKDETNIVFKILIPQACSLPNPTSATESDSTFYPPESSAASPSPFPPVYTSESVSSSPTFVISPSIIPPVISPSPSYSDGNSPPIDTTYVDSTSSTSSLTTIGSSPSSIASWSSPVPIASPIPPPPSTITTSTFTTSIISQPTANSPQVSTVITSSSVSATNTTTTTMSTPSTVGGFLCAPEVKDGDYCDPEKDLPRCSGLKWAQCVWGIDSNGLKTVGWLNRNCSEGTVCFALKDGGFYCDIPQNVPCSSQFQGVTG